MHTSKQIFVPVFVHIISNRIEPPDLQSRAAVLWCKENIAFETDIVATFIFYTY